MSLKAHHTNWYHGSLNADLEYLLKVAENNPLRLHPTNTDYLDVGTDSKGRSVIGYGYDLFANRLHSDTDLTAVGVVLTEAQKTALRNLTATGGIPAELQGLALPSEAAATDLLWKAIDARVPTFNAFLANPKINIVLPESRERAVLFSMWYQGQTKYFGTPDKPTNITQALIDGNRAEVWYEIRYGSAAVKPNSNDVLEATNGNGVVVRRFAESECFGLYDFGEAPNNTVEAASVYQMYTAHRDRILQYEATFGNVNGVAGSVDDLIAEANTNFNTPLHLNIYVDTLENTLRSAAESIMSTYLDEYGIAHTFDPLNIQMTSETVSELKGEDLPLRTGSADDLLIGRDQPDQQPPLLQSTFRDWLFGGQGNDVLIGLGGDDYLDGGEGDDTLIGGEGIDTYVISGHDRIIDTGRNNIIWDGKLIAGVFKEIKNNPGTYTFVSDDKEYCLAFHSPGQLTLSAEDSITFVNQTSSAGFDDNDFGIRLKEEPEITGVTFHGDLTQRDHTSGGSANDHLFGYGGNDELSGSVGDDILDGGDGEDILWGGAGSDFLYGGADYDNLVGDSPYTLTGGYDDYLDGGAGDDRVFGMGGSDVLLGGEGNDTLQGDEAENWVLGGQYHGDDVLDGGAGDDLLFGQGGSDILLGGAGKDFLYGDKAINESLEDKYYGNDTLYGGTGDDILHGQIGDDTLYGGEDNDKLWGEEGDDQLYGSDGNDELHGDKSNDRLEGGDGDDTLIGGDNDDILYGGADNDKLWGDNGDGAGTGNDTLYGGTGNDELRGGNGNDTLYGDEDNDTLFGQEGNDLLDGGEGEDKMYGGIGDDTYVVDVAPSMVIIGNYIINGGDIVDENANEGIDTVQSSVDYTLGANVENLTLIGDTAIFATGNSSDNVLTGNSGVNTLIGGRGNDTYVVDTFDYIRENTWEGTDTVQADFSYTLGTNLENLLLTGSEDIDGTGNELANVLTGNSGVNTLMGGVGNDTYVIDATDIITENTDEGTDTVQADFSYTLGANFENLLLTGTATIDGTGNSGINTLTGGVGNDTLDGGVGADTLTGGVGDDTYVIDSTDIFAENAGEGTDTVQVGFSYTLGANFENLTLTGSAAIDGTGNNMDNVLTGNSGANILDGGEGTDTLMGGAGNDTYRVDSAGDTLIEDVNAGTDTVQASVSHTLSDNIENLTLTGSAAIDGAGNELANVLTGNSGNNTLSGGAGNDTLYGGAGNDVYVFNQGDGQDVIDNTDPDTVAIDRFKLGAGLTLDTLYLYRSGDDLVLSFGSGADSVTVRNHFTTSPLDALVFADDTAWDGDMMAAHLATGLTTGNDIITGAIANDVLAGFAGDDMLLGEVGDEIFRSVDDYNFPWRLAA